MSDLLQNTKSISDILQSFGNEMQDKLRASIDAGGKFGSHNDSYELSQSIHFTAEIMGTRFVFELRMADYYDYVNKGVKGRFERKKAPNSPYRFKDKMPPVKSLSLWARKRGLNEFAVAKSIYNKGTYGSGFYDKVVTNNRIKQLQEDLQEASKNDLQTLVSMTANGVFGLNR